MGMCIGRFSQFSVLGTRSSDCQSAASSQNSTVGRVRIPESVGGVSHSDHNKELRFEGWVYQDENNADDALRIANIFEQLLKVYGEPLGIWP